MRFHLTENENRDLEPNEAEVEDENSSDSKVIKAIKKKTSSVKKAQKAIKQKLILKLQIIIAVAIVIVVVMWGQAERFLHWASGLEEIQITQKTTDNGCYEILTADSSSYCIDQESYDMAAEGFNYLIEETQYSFRLRMVE